MTEPLPPNAIVHSALFPEPVKVIVSIPFGANLKLVGVGLTSGRACEKILRPDQLSQLEISPPTSPFSGSANCATSFVLTSTSSTAPSCAPAMA